MNTQKIPQIGDRLFLMHREIVVMKVYLLFRVVVVRYTEEIKEFCVDFCALSGEPDYSSSISLRLFF